MLCSHVNIMYWREIRECTRTTWRFTTNTFYWIHACACNYYIWSMHREAITVKISCLRSKALMIFHWCLYSKLEYWLIPRHNWRLIWEYFCRWPEKPAILITRFLLHMHRAYVASIPLDFHHPTMNGMHRTQSDRAHLDLLSLVT